MYAQGYITQQGKARWDKEDDPEQSMSLIVENKSIIIKSATQKICIFSLKMQKSYRQLCKRLASDH